MQLREQAKQVYERLNTVPGAERYLNMFNRNVQFRVDGEDTFYLQVQDGRLEVKPGQAPQAGERMVMQTDTETLTGILSSRVKYIDAGGGYVGKFMCVEGIGNYPDLSWVGILTRLAQEWR